MVRAEDVGQAVIGLNGLVLGWSRKFSGLFGNVGGTGAGSMVGLVTVRCSGGCEEWLGRSEGGIDPGQHIVKGTAGVIFEAGTASFLVLKIIGKRERCIEEGLGWGESALGVAVGDAGVDDAREVLEGFRLGVGLNSVVEAANGESDGRVGHAVRVAFMGLVVPALVRGMRWWRLPGNDLAVVGLGRLE